MFRRLSEPLPLSEASLLALRPALNAPVLNVGFLPVGPARAAIVAFAEEWGGVGLALGIRSNESGQVAVFRNQESIEPDVSILSALEPALAEAERMGFLFDEDMVGSSSENSGRTQALELWGRLMGELEMPPAPRAAPAEPAATESIIDLTDMTAESPPPAAARSKAAPRELVLDEAVPAAPELDLEPERPPLPSRRDPRRAPEPTTPAPDLSQPTEPMVGESAAKPVSPPVPPKAKLSKFRHVDEAVAAAEDDVDANDMTGNQLGRIPLVRVRKGREGGKKVSYLARLLSSF